MYSRIFDIAADTDVTLHAAAPWGVTLVRRGSSQTFSIGVLCTRSATGRLDIRLSTSSRRD